MSNKTGNHSKVSKMSEYQHYEFHAIDRPLDSDAMASVREMSSRVQLSPSKAIFTYSYSDFRYDEEKVLVDYFDFMLYIANWGTKRMMMKFPFELVDYNFLKKYRISVIDDYQQEIRILKRNGYVIIDINFSEEEGLGWIEEGEYGYDFLNIRSEIMKGDYRSLFLVWLRFLENLYKSERFDFDYSIESKLIPLNLRQLSSSGYAVKNFYQVNEDWLDVMRSYGGEVEEEPDDYEAQILKMSKERMIEYMQLILRNEANLQIRLIKELKKKRVGTTNENSYIKLLEIGGKAVDIEQAKLVVKEKKRARETSERMNSIRQNKDHLEREVIESIEQGNSKGYKNALSKMMELKAMNDYFETEADFEIYVSQIRSDYSRKSSFIRMLKEKKLVE